MIRQLNSQWLVVIDTPEAGRAPCFFRRDAVVQIRAGVHPSESVLYFHDGSASHVSAELPELAYAVVFGAHDLEDSLRNDYFHPSVEPFSLFG